LFLILFFYDFVNRTQNLQINQITEKGSHQHVWLDELPGECMTDTKEINNKA